MSVNLEIIMEHTLTFDRMMALPDVFNKIKKLSDDCYLEAAKYDELNEYLTRRTPISDDNYSGDSWYIDDDYRQYIEDDEESDEFSGYDLVCALGFFSFNRQFCVFNVGPSWPTIATEFHLIEIMRIIGPIIGAKLALYGPDNMIFPQSSPFEEMPTLKYTSIEDLIFTHAEENGCIPDSIAKRIYEQDSWYFIDFF